MPPNKKLKLQNADSSNLNVIPKPSIDSDSDGGDNWRENCYGISDINAYALKKNILTDVTFRVGAEKKVFHAHRLILALGSPVFEAMFYGPLAEKGDSVTIPDVEPEGFYYLLRSLYTERPHFKDEMAAITTAVAADKYCCSFLKKMCERYLCNTETTASNVWPLLQNALYLNLNDLTQMCFNYLKSNLDAALNHGSFLETSVSTVEALLSRSCVRVSEKRLLESVLQWAQRNSDDEDRDSFRETMRPLLPFVRFRSLKAEEFVHFLETRRLKEAIGTEDSLAILEHILAPDECDLPNWCLKTVRVAPPPQLKVVSIGPPSSSALDQRKRMLPFSDLSSSSSWSSSSTDSSSTSSLSSSEE